MRRRKFVALLGGMAAAAPFAARAAQLAKVRRIGLLCATAPDAFAARIAAFRNGLRELGYVEGKNIIVDYRFGDGKIDRMAAFAAELVRRKVDVIVTVGGVDTRAARNATRAIPIVMMQDPDPIASGFVASLARPGGNITGLSRLVPEIGGKQLELLKEAFPKLSRIAVLGTSKNPINAGALRTVQAAAQMRGMAIHFLDISSVTDIKPSFRAATEDGAEAALLLSSPIFLPARKEIVALAAHLRLPAIYDRREFVEAGGLMSYGTDIESLARYAATYVDKILKGARPSDLPVEQPTKFELVVNLKTARALGAAIPPAILLRADSVIE